MFKLNDGLAPIIVFVCYLVVVALFGGASRADALSQPIIRVAAIVFGCIALLMADRRSIRKYDKAWIFLACFATLIAVQLIPLPPSIWTALPGRAPIAAGAAIAGMEQPWRPLSLTPDLTMNSLMALLPAAAAVLLFANVSRRHHLWVLTALLGLFFLSGLMGLAQVTMRGDWLYPYRITNDGLAVGLFANRNHQALLLTMTFPLLAAMSSMVDMPDYRRATSRFILLAAGLFLLPLIIVTGSRAGILLAVAGIGCGIAIFRTCAHHGRKRRRTSSRKRAVMVWLGAFGAVAALVITTVYFSRAEGIQRLLEQGFEEERRFTLFWPMAEVAKIMFPFGSGFGSFPDVFRIHEPFHSLAPSYMNHAHNDLLELVIEGGLVAALLLFAFLAWSAARAVAAWKRKVDHRVIMARLGSTFIVLILLASLVDYPLRTPTISVLFVLSCCWMMLPEQQRETANLPDERLSG